MFRCEVQCALADMHSAKIAVATLPQVDFFAELVLSVFSAIPHHIRSESSSCSGPSTVE